MKKATEKSAKVYVGMSGGVDSSVSAALLKKAGYDVTGVFIKVWQPDWIECTWREDLRDAMRVAATLDIPFVTLDFEKEYKKDVIDYMIAEYAAGRTPNPDVMCNRYVKFGAFWKWASENGADYIATGHYARVAAREIDENNTGLKSTYSLLVGTDANKDQSYFLWTLNQTDLPHVLFPVGSMTKPEVRKLAQTFGLPTASKKDSQGLCFVGKVDIKEFLSRYVNNVSGEVLDESGNVIGTHPGSLLFTIGERHGFTITEKTPADEPYYVVSKDIVENTITVSKKDIHGHLSVGSKEAHISKVNWVSGQAPTEADWHKMFARSRYRQPLQHVVSISADADADRVTIGFMDEQDTLTPGQSLVIYDGEKCLGGGILE